ncbi:MAG: hypothetical protein H0X03_08230 [Nitrosopumilus sp.]|nr:hypothetical protein [Nitrosopumilus sp.]
MISSVLCSDDGIICSGQDKLLLHETQKNEEILEHTIWNQKTKKLKINNIIEKIILESQQKKTREDTAWDEKIKRSKIKDLIETLIEMTINEWLSDENNIDCTKYFQFNKLMTEITLYSTIECHGLSSKKN